jgi:hypothetical protein
MSFICAATGALLLCDWEGEDNVRHGGMSQNAMIPVSPDLPAEALAKALNVRSAIGEREILQSHDMDLAYASSVLHERSNQENLLLSISVANRTNGVLFS